MTWLRFGLLALSWSFGLFSGWVLSGWWSSPVTLENVSLRADKALMAQAADYTRQLHERSAAQARRSIDMLLDRLERARAGREVRYEYRDRIIERIPRDRLCLDADDLRVLDDAARFAGTGPLAGAGDPGRADEATTGPATPDAGLSAGAAGQWIDRCRRQYEAAGERLEAWRQWGRIHDGVAGRVRIEQEAQ